MNKHPQVLPVVEASRAIDGYESTKKGRFGCRNDHFGRPKRPFWTSETTVSASETAVSGAVSASGTAVSASETAVSACETFFGAEHAGYENTRVRK